MGFPHFLPEAGPKFSDPTTPGESFPAENLITDFLVRRTVREGGRTDQHSRDGASASRRGPVPYRAGSHDDPRNHHLGEGEERTSGIWPDSAPGRAAASASITRRYPIPLLSPGRPVTGSGTATMSFQRGDFFAFNVGVNYMGFGTDTKTHAYILREGETGAAGEHSASVRSRVAGQWIMRDHMRVGMTAKEALDAMVQAMEAAGYLYTPFVKLGNSGHRTDRRRHRQPRLCDHPERARRHRSAGIRHRQSRLRHRRQRAPSAPR